MPKGLYVNLSCHLPDEPGTVQAGDIAELVFARDGKACVFCGATERLEIDHIVPMVRGGSDDDSNLQTLCKRCNSGKRDR